jgi:hypothetical protein
MSGKGRSDMDRVRRCKLRCVIRWTVTKTLRMKAVKTRLLGFDVTQAKDKVGELKPDENAGRRSRRIRLMTELKPDGNAGKTTAGPDNALSEGQKSR